MHPTHDARRVILAAARLLPRRVLVAGSSMAPTLEPGDRLVVVARRRVRPGQIVALEDPRGGRILVKRVAAVGPGGVEVLGDDPARSTDSRTFGPVAPQAVLGEAVYRYAPPARAGRLRGGRSDGPARQ